MSIVNVAEFSSVSPNGQIPAGAPLVTYDIAVAVGSTAGPTFNPATMETFSSQGDGTLTVIKEDSPTSFSVEQTVPTPGRAKTLTLDTKTGHIYLITAEFGPTPAASAQSSAAPPVPTAPAPGTTPGASLAGAPAFARGPRAPMIPHSFQIIVVGKE